MSERAIETENDDVKALKGFEWSWEALRRNQEYHDYIFSHNSGPNRIYDCFLAGNRVYRDPDLVSSEHYSKLPDWYIENNLALQKFGLKYFVNPAIPGNEFKIYYWDPSQVAWSPNQYKRQFSQEGELAPAPPTLNLYCDIPIPTQIRNLERALKLINPEIETRDVGDALYNNVRRNLHIYDLKRDNCDETGECYLSSSQIVDLSVGRNKSGNLKGGESPSRWVLDCEDAAKEMICGKYQTLLRGDFLSTKGGPPLPTPRYISNKFPNNLRPLQVIRSKPGKN